MAKQPDRCHRWPECVCGKHWRHFQDAPDEHFVDAGPIIEAMLACVSERCPDRRARAHATIQLLNPTFAQREDAR